MRKKLAGILLALTIGLGGMIAMPAQPAKADISSLFGSLTSILMGGFNLNGVLSQAISGIIGAIQQSESDILGQIDQLASVQAVSCSNDAVLEYPDINNFNPDVLQNWAQSTTSCVSTIEALWAAIPASNVKVRNELGIALSTVGPIAVTAREKAGLSTTALVSSLISAFTNVKIAFTPYCYYQPDPTTAELMDADDQNVFYNVGTNWICNSPLYPDSSEPNEGTAGSYTFNTWQDYSCLDCNLDTGPMIAEAGKYNSYGLAVTALSVLLA
jgi:hypothetical protein